MVEIVGKYRGQSKTGKEFCILYYTFARDGLEYGDAAESCICSPEYAEKLEQTAAGGEELVRGWSAKEGKPFLFVKK